MGLLGQQSACLHRLVYSEMSAPAHAALRYSYTATLHYIGRKLPSHPMTSVLWPTFGLSAQFVVLLSPLVEEYLVCSYDTYRYNVKSTIHIW